ncbi:uncharacterized protein LOC108631404 [Ceratina calcarata]|uniref:Uncharacterized protein LOC108631404 n=1 Tax=Ceratina calcarata TaxID=156304 RepID=A0AAJ7SD87_9HYME|nr:uncharacterized protein LOC108631404 [Ceratina calcarata]
MDQFMTTYKRDFTWPTTRIKRMAGVLGEESACRCREPPRELTPLTRCGDDYDWSRTGPMGRLLDPKLYPAKTGPHPESEATKHDQPSTYMRKLEEKYPNLYGILQSTPIDEVIKRVDEDRMKTTYQLDYSVKAAEQMEEIATGPCAAYREQKATIDCRPSTKSKLDKRRLDKEKTKTAKKVTEDESQETRLPPWRSEYQDNVSRLGSAIMKQKIHHKKTAAPAWAMAVL